MRACVRAGVHVCMWGGEFGGGGGVRVRVCVCARASTSVL